MAEEGGGLFTPIIKSLASLIESFGIPSENAVTYAKILVYGGTVLIIFIFVIWIVRFARGK